MIERKYVPGGVAPVVFTVSVDDFADASVIVIVGGTKLEVESLERPVTLRAMLPVNPPAGVAVSVKLVLPPAVAVCDPGKAEIE